MCDIYIWMDVSPYGTGGRGFNSVGKNWENKPKIL